MTLEELFELLRSRAPGGELKLQKSDLPPSSPIVPLFDRFLNGNPLEISGASIDIPLGLDYVLVAGKGKSDPFAELSVTAHFTIDAQHEPALDFLDGTPIEPIYKPTIAFPKLGDTFYDHLQLVPTTKMRLSSTATPPFTWTVELDFVDAADRLMSLFQSPSRQTLTLHGEIDRVDVGIPTFKNFEGVATTQVRVGPFEASDQKLTLTCAPVADAQGAVATGMIASWVLKPPALPSLEVSTAYPFDGQPTMFFTADVAGWAGQALSAFSQITGTQSALAPFFPTELSIVDRFKLTQWVIEVDPNQYTVVSVSFGIGFANETSWTIVDPVTLEDIILLFTIAPGSPQPVSLTVMPQLRLSESILLTLYATFPRFAMGGTLLITPPQAIDLKSFAGKYLPGSQQLMGTNELPIGRVQVLIDPAGKAYSLDATIVGDAIWSFEIAGKQFSVTRIDFKIGYKAGGASGLVGGVLRLGSPGGPELALAAAYDSKRGWTFGATAAKIDLKALTEYYFSEFAEYLPDVTIKKVGASVTRPNDPERIPSYGFEIDCLWSFSFDGGKAFQIEATLKMATADKPGEPPTGQVSGLLNYVGDGSGSGGLEGMKLKVTYDFGRTRKITITFAGVVGTYDLETRKAKIEFPRASLGEMVRTLVQAAAPNDDFTLLSPWDSLNGLTLDRVTLWIDFVKKTASVNFAIDFNVVFAEIQEIALVYDLNPTGKKPLNFNFTRGRFLDQKIPEDRPELIWDVTTPGNTPGVPGLGAGLFDLDFFALGQHVSPGAIDTTTISSAVDDLRRAFVPSQLGAGDPIPPTLHYDANTNWLIGLSAWVLGNTVQLKTIFLDPLLYGVSVSLVGPKAGKFQTLRFEVLYKRIADDLGVYQADVTLSREMNHFELGSVSISLPSVSVWIFTNGDFLVDFGFPQNGDFSRSFCVQALPFIGAGGFYFGKLSGATSTTLPHAEHGNFSPVIELGFGLALGLGRTLSAGILTGGMSLTLQGIVQGTFATYNPYRGEDPSATWYLVEGKFALVGKIYGAIDFAIIAARLDVTVTLSITLRIEAYEKIRFTFAAEVRVSLSVRINLGLFSITIGFSWSMTVSYPVEIGEQSRPPWGELPPRSRTRALWSSWSAPECTTPPALNWQPVYNDQPWRVDVLLVPQLTAASEATGPVPDPGHAQLVAMLFVRTDEPSSRSDFEAIAQGALLWAIGALLDAEDPHPTLEQLRKKPITLEQLADLRCALSAPTLLAPFTVEHVVAFLRELFDFQVRAARPASDGDSEKHVSVFPMVPLMTLTRPDGKRVPFDAWSPATPQKLQAIKDELDQLAARYPIDGVGPAPNQRRAPLKGDEQSLATFMFVDYFALLCRAGVQAAFDAMQAPTHDAQGSMAELAAVGARSSWSVEDIARTNRVRRLAEGAQLVVPAPDGGAPAQHRVAEGDTLLAVSRRYRVELDALARANADVAPLFARDERVLLPVITDTIVGELLDRMHAEHRFDAIAGMSARVAMQGLRPSWPTEGGGEAPLGLYEIAGQQFPVPVLATPQSFTLSLPEAYPWLAFYDDHERTASLTVTIDDQLEQIIRRVEDAELNPNFTAELQPFYTLRARRFTLGAPIRWRDLDGVAPERTLWRLPAELRQLLATVSPKVALEEEQADAEHLPPRPLRPSLGPAPHTWTMRIDVKLRQIPSDADPTRTLPSTYELLGAGEESGVLLLRLIEWSAAHPTVDLIEGIDVLFAPTANAAPAIGLVSHDPAKTTFFVVQTNLSTESHPASAHALAAPSPLGMTALELLRLVWECTVVRSGGYHFYYAHEDEGGSSGLPDYLFAGNGECALTLLVRYQIADDVLLDFVDSVAIDEPLDPETLWYLRAVLEPARVACRGETLASVAARHGSTVWELASRNADARLAAGTELTIAPRRSAPAATQVERLQTTESLAAIAARHGVSLARLAIANRDRPLAFDDELLVEDGLTERVLSVPPGNAGFIVDRVPAPLPPPWTGAGPAFEAVNADVDRWYNLLDYRVAKHGVFSESPYGLPLTPLDDGAAPDDAAAWSRPRAPADDDHWRYRAVVPVAAFAPPSPPVPGAPDPERDPYRGVGEQALIELEFHDLFGNRLRSAGAPYQLPVTLGYFDELIALSEWPGLSYRYALALDGEPASPRLIVRLAFDTSRYSSKDWVALATADHGKYAAIYYQLARHVTIRAACSLEPDRTHEVTAPLVALVLDIYKYLSSILPEPEPPTPTPIEKTISLPTADASGRALFALEASLVIARDVALIADETDDAALEPVQTSTTRLKPDYVQAPGASESAAPVTLEQFARNVQACFPSLHVAAGRPDDAAGADPTSELWLVRFGDGGFRYNFDGEPRYLAPVPLARSPQSVTGVQIRPYPADPTTPIWEANPVPTSFANVDVDLLARKLFDAVELFLSPDYVVPAWLALFRDGERATNPIRELLRAKQSIARAVADSAAPVYADQVTPEPTAWQKAARDKLEQELLVELTAAYRIDAIVVLRAIVESREHDPTTAPRLYGQTEVVPPPGAPRANEASAALSTASLSLNDAPDGAMLAFTFSRNEQLDASVASLPVRLRVSHLEHERRPVDAVTGYFASSWLSFVVPRDPDDLGTPQIPIALRAFPTAPVFSQQRTSPLSVDETLAERCGFIYDFGYSYAGASQDRLHVTLDLNVATTPLRRDSLPTLLDTLLQFDAVYEAVAKDLASANDELRVHAVESLAWMVGQVAEAWPRWKPPALDGVAPQLQDRLTVEEAALDDGTLEIIVSRDDPALLLPLPIITIDGYREEVTRFLPSVNRIRYVDPAGGYLQRADARRLAGRDFSVEHYDVREIENVWAGVQVKRNEVFVAGGGERRDGNPQFIYTTPLVRFATPASPLLTNDRELLIAQYTSQPPPPPPVNRLHVYLANLMLAVLGGTPLKRIRLSCFYDYRIGDRVAFDVEVPLFLSMPFDIPDDVRIAECAKFIASWFAERQLEKPQGTLRFELSLFSSLSAQPLPLVTLSRLTLDARLIW